jgi:hypothetical protein
MAGHFRVLFRVFRGDRSALLTLWTSMRQMGVDSVAKAKLTARPAMDFRLVFGPNRSH